jgi:PAS domain S-box-containing protein
MRSVQVYRRLRPPIPARQKIRMLCEAAVIEMALLPQEILLNAGALQDAIFNSANFSSIATDANGVIQIFNVGAERMLGYTAPAVVNKITPADISDPQELIARAQALSVEFGTAITPGFEALVFKASRGIEDIYELTYIREDCTRFPAVVSVTALRDAGGDIIGYLLIGTDNTARKQVEDEQQKLNQRLRDQQFYTRSLIESNIDALMTTDTSGIISDVNKQMEALTGCTRDELIGAPFKKFFADPERAEAAIKLVLSERKVTNYELTARARDGTELVVSYNATTFYDRDRKLQGVFAAARDVTELKRFERTLQEKNDELQHASDMKSAFLATMSHELRTPLNGMLGMLELLSLSRLNREQRDTLEIARMSGRGLVRLINDVLDHARIEAGKLEIRLEPMSITQMLKRVVHCHRGVASSKNIVLTQSADPRISPCVMADPLRLLQILDNLVSNALKFTPKGTVEIWAELRERTEGIDTVCFSVRDTGIGIEAEAQKRLFQPFEQAAATTARLYGGTGLGLSISRSLAEMMGGTIDLESTPGSGTTVNLTLPLSIGEIEAGDQTSESSQIMKILVDGAGEGSEPIVLAVDDHPTNRELLARQVEALGLLAQTAVDGIEALALWKAGGIAVVVTDCNMPGMDGYALSRAIREHEEKEGLARTPIIAWTANVLPSAAAICRAAGMDDILTKPAELKALRKTLTTWLPSGTVSALRPADLADALPREGPVAALTLAGLSKIASTAEQRTEILVDFISNSESDLSDLRIAQRISDLPACARIAHRMLGSSLMIGATELAGVCENMERAARMGSTEDVIKADAAMDGALARLDAHLAEAQRVIAQ